MSATNGTEVGSDRYRLSKLALLLIIGAALFLLLRTWHGRAIDVELVHRFPSGDRLLPAEIEIQVWNDDVLHGDAYFPDPESLAELEHTVRVPPGRYRVTYAVLKPFPNTELRYERWLTVEGEGRYYLSYELEE